MPTNTLSTKIVSQTIGLVHQAASPLEGLAGRLVPDRAVVGHAAAGHDLVVEVGREPPCRLVLAGHQGDQVDDVLGVEPARPGRASGSARCAPPQTCALPIRTTSPATEPSTLPPDSAARSTTTEPGFICSTIARGDQQRRLPAGHGGGGDQRVGGGDVRRRAARAAGRPGPRSSRGRSRRRPRGSRARGRSDLAPIERISSAAAARTSYALTTAPSRLARRDRLQPGDAGAEHDHLGGRDGAGRGHVQREEPAQHARPRRSRSGSRRPAPARTARPSTGRARSAAPAPSRTT